MSNKTITKDEMMPALLAVCPSFEPHWREFRTEWEDDPDRYEDGQDGSLPLYIALSGLANHLIGKLEADETENFDAIFDVVERLIIEGDHYVSEAAIIGLIEDLTSEVRYKKKKSPNDFVRWLGAESKDAWVAVIDFWDSLERKQRRPLFKRIASAFRRW